MARAEVSESGSHSNVTGFSGAMLNSSHAVLSDPTPSSQEVRYAAPSWFAVQTWPRYEKKVAAEFTNREVEVFLPLLSSRRKWSDRWAVIEQPLFPSYVFVRVDETARARIELLRTNGVTGFVGAHGKGAAISSVEIESVRSLLANDVAFQFHPHLTVGKRVRIRGGSLDGVEGTLVEKNDDLSMLVSIQIIQRSLAIRVAGYKVEPV
jgi:transcription antitermination factor NusG